jgi:hypothetical protein
MVTNIAHNNRAVADENNVYKTCPKGYFALIPTTTAGQVLSIFILSLKKE